MPRKRTDNAFHPATIYSDEYYEIYDRLVPILSAHFKNCKKFKAKEEAHKFITDYSYIRQNLWTKEMATESLDDLRRATISLADAYYKTPQPILDELAIHSEEVLQAAKN